LTSYHNIPFADSPPVVTYASRLVCDQFLANQQSVVPAGITGMDGYDSIGLDDGNAGTPNNVFWSFGDTFVPAHTAGLVGNEVATTTDHDGSDCSTFAFKTDTAGLAAPMLERLEGDPAPEPQIEWSAFPTGWVQPNVGDTSIYFYYDSTPYADPHGIQGSGIAKADVSNPASPAGSRIPSDCDTAPECLLWFNLTCNSEPVVFSAAATLRAGDVVYIYLEKLRPSTQPNDVLGNGVARVQLTAGNLAALENASSYEYYNGSGWSADPCQMAAPWTPFTFGADTIRNNGLSVRRNPFVESLHPESKYVAVYSSRFGSTASARTAPNPWGPWSPEVDLVDCRLFLNESDPNFPDHYATVPGLLCYNARQHPSLEKLGGRVSYVTYSNTKSYRTYLQEVLLGTAVYQWEDANGHTAYRRDGVAGPTNFQQKGIAFYAFFDGNDCSPQPADIAYLYSKYDLVPVRELKKTGTSEYVYVAGSSSVPSGWDDDGIQFCASKTAPNGLDRQLAPISMWRVPTDPGTHVYSPLDLGSSNGYTFGGVSFYAQVTTERYTVPDNIYINNRPDRVFPTVGQMFELRLAENGVPVSSGPVLAGESADRLAPNTNYAFYSCDPVTFVCGGTPFSSSATTGSLGAMSTASSLNGPYFLIAAKRTGSSTNDFADLNGLTFYGLTQFHWYELSVCSPSCDFDTDPLIYQVAANSSGVLYWGTYRQNTAPIIRIVDADVPADDGVGGLKEDGAVTFTDSDAVNAAAAAVASTPAPSRTSSWYRYAPYDLLINGTVDGWDGALISQEYGLSNWPPYGPELTVPSTGTVHFSVMATDQNGTVPSMSVSYTGTTPTGACFNTAGCPGQFLFTPNGTYHATFTATFAANDGALTSSTSITIHVL